MCVCVELRIPMFQRLRVLVLQGHAFWDNFGEHHQIATFRTCTKRSYPAGFRLAWTSLPSRATSCMLKTCCVLLGFAEFLHVCWMLSLSDATDHDAKRPLKTIHDGNHFRGTFGD